MALYDDLLSKKESLAVVGLGYVGMPIAVEFSKKVNVIGFDLNKEKIDAYKSGYDPTKEVGDEAIRECSVDFTADENKLDNAKFFIVAVPTPVNIDKTPDLTPVESASRTVGKHLSVGSIVVFESTVYPGVTEDVCVCRFSSVNQVCGVELILRSVTRQSESIPETRFTDSRILKKSFPEWMLSPVM